MCVIVFVNIANNNGRKRGEIHPGYDSGDERNGKNWLIYSRGNKVGLPGRMLAGT